MNIKILKYELFVLFFLTISTLFVFYYRDTLPDSYLSISSRSEYGFFTYYSTSFLNFVSYYSGPWVLMPCLVFTSFYVLVFSKRADVIDVINIFSLSIFSLLSFYFLKPAMLGAGLYQLLDTRSSVFVMVLVWISALFIFLWGSFRGVFVSKVKGAVERVVNFKSTEMLNSFKSFCLKGKSLVNKNEMKSIEQVAVEEEVGDKVQFSVDSSQVEASGVVNLISKSQGRVDQIPIIDSKSVEMAFGFQGEELVPVVSDGSEENQDGLIFSANVSEKSKMTDDEEFVDESEISIFKDKIHKVETYNDDKYYNLVRVVSHKKIEPKDVQLSEKYFHDIINKIQAKLSEFRIQGQIVNVLKGPVVDTFEWELGAGEKVARLTSIADDLSLALSGAPIRMVYPMKGRTTVGIEVPRNPREFIFLDEILNSKDFKETNHKLPLAMGKDAFGEANVQDLASMPHMLVAGSTGAGKSVFINSILVSLLVKKSPNQMKLILIDPKQLELALYARLPHLIMPVVTEPKMAATALLWACQEMERRYSIMSEMGVRNIEGFNHKLKSSSRETLEKLQKYYEYATEDTYELPYIVVIVDEFADLMLSAKKVEIENHIAKLAAKARASGIHLILATQRPSVDVITGVIKGNFPTRVSFRVTTSTDSRTILNAMGAEKLLGKGDMLFKQNVDTTRIHSSFIDESEIEALTEKLSEMSPLFSPEVLEFLENGGVEEIETGSSVRDGESFNGKDDKYDEAVRVVVENRSASASLLQRRLGVGYNRAAKMIEEMESQGVVGPAQGSKPRKVLQGSESLS